MLVFGGGLRSLSTSSLSIQQVVGEEMRLSGNWLLAQSFVTTILYKLLRLVYITVQRIYWQLNGTAQKLRQARLPGNYERSAQVLDVVLWHKFCPLLTTTLDNFLCTYNRFEDPQYIIDNDNITLMTINEHDAVFCEAKEKGWLLSPIHTADADETKLSSLVASVSAVCT